MLARQRLQEAAGLHRLVVFGHALVVEVPDDLQHCRDRARGGQVTDRIGHRADTPEYLSCLLVDG